MTSEPIKALWPVTATLDLENGGTVIRINGKPVIPLWFYGNTYIRFPEYSRFVEATDLAVDAGVCIMMWVNELDVPEHNDRINRELFERHPDIYVMLRMDIESPRLEGEVAINNNGAEGIYNSFGSLYWRKDMDERLGRYFQWLRQQPYADRVIGFQPMHNYSGEWFFMTLEATEETGLADDYSEPARKCFAAWLRDTYQTNEALQKAWRGESVTFETVSVPSLEERDKSLDGYFKDPLLERKSIDYANFYRTFIPDAIEYTAGLFKKYTGDNCLVSIMYGYNLKMNATFPRPAATGCFGLGEALKIKHVDIISSPCNYFDRRMGLSNEPMGTFDAPSLYGKMVMIENDTRTHLVLAPDYTAENDYYPDAFGTSSRQETIWETRRDTAINTITGNGMYWMDLVSRGWWNDPYVWDENQNLLRIHGAKYMNADNRSFCPQIAFIIDEVSMSYITLNPQDAFDTETGYLWHLINYQSWELARSGMSYGYYTMQELPVLPESVRMLILPHTYLYSSETQSLLERFKKDGRMILFMRAPGYISDQGNSVENMERLTGIRFLRLTQSPAITVVSNKEDAATSGCSGMSIGYHGSLEPAFAVDDQQAIVLGFYKGTGWVSFVRKELSGWHSVYISTPNIKADLLRNLGRICGCHCWLDSTLDSLRTDGTMFMYHSAKQTEGERTINLKAYCRVLDLSENRLISEKSDKIRFHCEPVETKLFLALPLKSVETPAEEAFSSKALHADGGKVKARRGDTLSFSFTGSYIALHTRSGPSCGRIAVSLDGVEMPYIDTYTYAESDKEYLIAYGMHQKEHILTLSVLDTKNRNSASYGVELYGFVTEKKEK